MDIIDRLNSVFTIKFVEDFDLLSRGDRKYYLLKTYDDKRYIFKVYQKNSNNLTKLNDANDLQHILSKENDIYPDYIINKDYEAIVEFEEDGFVGTLYPFQNGDFLSYQDVKLENLKKLVKISKDLHTLGSEIVEKSFTIAQIENVSSVLKRDLEKIRSEINENGIHYLLENKFGLVLDKDMVELNLSHVENIIERLSITKPTILNMDSHFENITFDENGEVSNVIFDRVNIGHPYFEISKSISRLLVNLKGFTTNDLKKLYLQEVEDKSFLEDEMIDSLICFYLIDMLYKMIKNETFRELEDRFLALKTKLLKEKILKIS